MSSHQREGMCNQDSRVHFIKARTTWYQGVSTPMEAEA